MNNKVRAKFKVKSVTSFEMGSEVKLEPVTSGSVENESFFKWTPFGEIKMGLMNSELADDFAPGAEFYVDFTLEK
jgi:hypothetical protein